MFGYAIRVLVSSWVLFIVAAMVAGVVGRFLESFLAKHLSAQTIAALVFGLPLIPLLFPQWRQTIAVPGKYFWAQRVTSYLCLVALATVLFANERLGNECQVQQLNLKQDSERKWAHLLRSRTGTKILATIAGELLGLEAFAPAIRGVVGTIWQTEVPLGVSIAAGIAVGVVLSNILFVAERSRLIRKGGGEDEKCEILP